MARTSIRHPTSGLRRVCRLVITVAAALGTTDLSAAAEAGAVQKVTAWITSTGDSHGMPFAIIDKVDARVFLFDATGALVGSAPVLVGLARGDRSAPGVGSRPLAKISPAERTTPAGRFDGEIGTDTAGHTILWIDYADAIALHAVVTSNPAEHRLQRLASASPADHRISYGCINVPASFFATVVEPMFRPHGGVVYILPEESSLEQVFGLAPPNAAKSQSKD